MAPKLDYRGWTTAHDLAPCVLCRQARHPPLTPRQALPLDVCPGLGQPASGP
jgi:hypothetical protein